MGACENFVRQAFFVHSGRRLTLVGACLFGRPCSLSSYLFPGHLEEPGDLYMGRKGGE